MPVYAVGVEHLKNGMCWKLCIIGEKYSVEYLTILLFCCLAILFYSLKFETLHFFLQEQLQFKMHSLVKELDPSSWMVYNALALKIALWTVTTMDLVFITVPPPNVLVLCVQVSNYVWCSSTVLQMSSYNVQCILRMPSVLDPNLGSIFMQDTLLGQDISVNVRPHLVIKIVQLNELASLDQAKVSCGREQRNHWRIPF